MFGDGRTVFRTSVVCSVLGIVLAACSGGSDGPSNLTPPASVSPPSAPTIPSFNTGVFERADLFEARCEAPRSGVDIEGNAFPDQAGTLLEELFWLRSWTNETYLFRDEVADRDPNDFTDRVAYFDVLRTTAVTPSGEDKDDFHFSQPTDEFLESRNSTPAPRYGVSYAAISTTVPRDFRVRFTEPNSPASELEGGVPKLVRGARILEVDGVDLVNASTQGEIDTLNAGLFPSTVGETHTFVVQEPGAAGTRTVTLTAANISTAPVNRVRILNTASGDVGYVLFNTFSPFSSEEQLADAFAQLDAAGVTDLVLDLRYNGGGLLAVASQLSYMIAGDARTAGRDFERLRFNDAAGNRNPVTGAVNDPTPFFTTGLGFTLANGTPLNTLDLSRVFVLTTGDTCSASESVINSLRGVGIEVILIGDTTCGKPFGFFPTDNCGETYFTIQFQGVNDQGFGDYADGFIPQNSGAAFGVRVPGCQVADDLDSELGDPAEDLLAAALQFRTDGTCPPVPAGTSSFEIRRVSDSASDIMATEITPQEDVVLNNRDMRLPY